MKRLIFALNLSLCFSTASLASNTCSDKDTYNYKSIECCISKKLTIETCKDSVDKLDTKLVELIQDESQKIIDGVYKDGEAPNCFWNSIAFHSSTLRTPAKTWYQYQFLKELKKGFLEVDQNEVHYGSIFYFDGPQTLYPDHLGGEPVTINIPFHSGIILSGGLIIQKENSSDHIFSITTFKRSFEGYKKAYLESTGETLIPRFFNKN